MPGTLVVLGTRPDAIKLAPLVHALAATDAGAPVHVCATAQHREMLDPVLELFEIEPDSDLDAMPRTSGLADLTATLLRELSETLEAVRPDRLVVQGDTTTAASAALAAFYLRIPVAHVEAGLRTGDMSAPLPEELNRRLITLATDMHFAPTDEARANLLAEGTDAERVTVTGNTVIDALLYVVRRFDADPSLEAGHAERFSFLDPERRLLLVTGHRRENFDHGLAGICAALRELVEGHEDVEVVYPVHLNPVVREVVAESLGGDHPRIHLAEPASYPEFIHLMRRAHLILSDSGGVQEEAPALGKPVLVLREKTERPEVIEQGAARLVGTDTATIVAAARELLDDDAAYGQMAQVRWIYGDGRAAERIAAALAAR